MKALLALTLLISTNFAAQAAIAPADAFAAIKKLEGDWRGPGMPGMPPAHSIFRLTSGGSAVQETIFPGTKMEMLSVYHMNKGELLMTHYCALGNAPQVKLNARKSTSTELIFDFDGGTNFNPRRDMHMHSLVLKLPTNTKSTPKLVVSGTSWADGKEKAGCESVLTKRK